MKASHFDGLITTILGYILLAGALIICHVSLNPRLCVAVCVAVCGSRVRPDWCAEGNSSTRMTVAPHASLLDLNCPLGRLWLPW